MGNKNLTHCRNASTLDFHTALRNTIDVTVKTHLFSSLSATCRTPSHFATTCAPASLAFNAAGNGCSPGSFERGRARLNVVTAAAWKDTHSLVSAWWAGSDPIAGIESGQQSSPWGAP